MDLGGQIIAYYLSKVFQRRGKKWMKNKEIITSKNHEKLEHFHIKDFKIKDPLNLKTLIWDTEAKHFEIKDSKKIHRGSIEGP